MNNVLSDILNNLNEGIIILDSELRIYLWNKYMKIITKIDAKKAVNNNIYKVMPSLNKKYFKRTIENISNNACKMFFSAAMHKGLINSKEDFNLVVSSFEMNKSKFFLLEFINVTNQFKQINMLKDYIQELYRVNIELEKKERIIKKLAYYDSLTGVANRTLFYEFAKKLLNNSKRKNSILGLMFIDIDNFKCINDTYGHAVGDKILIKVANVLKETTRKNDVVARYGGDEFLILLTNIKNINNYNGIVSRIINDKNKIIRVNEKEINVSLSMGASFYPDSGDTIDKLMIQADKAMYTAKNRKGENCFECDLQLS